MLKDPKHTKIAKKIVGIRQMDDLIIFMAHEKKEKKKAKERKYLEKYITEQMYKGGLEAEIEKPEVETKEKFINHFAGLEIYTGKDFKDIYTRTLNPNRESIKRGEGQKKIRYPYSDTYADKHIKSGFIIGTLHRIKETCTYREHFTEEVMNFVLELISIG